MYVFTLVQKVLLFIKESECITVSTKILSSTTVFSIDYNKKSLLQQISVLEGFLKGQMTMKTGLMILKIQLCNHMNKHHFTTF